MKKSVIMVLAVLGVVAALAVGAQVYLNRLAEKRVSATIEGYRAYAAIEYDKVAIGLLDGKARVRGLRVSSPRLSTVTVDEFVLHSFRWGLGEPSRQHFEARGVRPGLEAFLDAPPPPGVARAGNVDSPLLLECDYNYDSASRMLDLTTIRLAADNGGELTLELTLDNLDLAQVRLSMAGMFQFFRQVLPRARILKGRLAYTDKSLIPELIKRAAQEKGVAVEDMVAQMDASMAKRMEGESSPAVRAILKKNREFLRHPEKMTISINPPQPLELGALRAEGRPGRQVEMLGLEVSL